MYHVYRYTVYDSPEGVWWVDGICTCLAGEAGRVCYHTALVGIARGEIPLR